MKAEILLCGVASPLLLGIYVQGELRQSLSFSGKAGEGLLELWQQALDLLSKNHWTLSRLIIARGPGSFTAIKLSYIFAQSVAIAKGITLAGVDSFALNNNMPVFAFAQSYFVKENEEIVLRQNVVPGEFILPLKLNSLEFSVDCSPLYILPAL